MPLQLFPFIALFSQDELEASLRDGTADDEVRLAQMYECGRRPLRIAHDSESVDGNGQPLPGSSRRDTRPALGGVSGAL